ncbi:ribonuclease E [Clostridium homopropionicum DSM 5847]|uniref:Ribonuclease E n=1 Tax=Clostridium homopropionicum DSM 5847 TaxID=1121318 RepID=A0A0L6ZES1_9CLOT|nr:ribonuclease E/G [Clostridium homopropionicum]KOA21273.1 ribonuclease E [Clostridium homopropionicum DSM 5847]SFG29517.1 ribonuclease G [Clostridium homopropionicum]
MEEIFIEREKDSLRIAIKENGSLKECLIEEDNSEPSPGELYKGVVKNIVASIKCAFIDIGCKKNAYMLLHHKFDNDKIKVGDEVIVEIMKEATGEKGAKVTSQISVPGRYVILISHNNKINFSKKIEGNTQFIEYVHENINKPSDVGVMVRTNALNSTIEDINRELEELYDSYLRILKQGKHSLKLGLLYNGGGALGRLLIDVINEDTSKIIVNSQEDYGHIERFIKNKSDINLSLELHKDPQSIFSLYNIEKELLSLRNSKVVLPSGGNIIIEKTEAMYVIDVNSSKNTKETSIDKTAFSTDLEAAKEIARQIMLRNLGGIIVIDFIDIESNEKRKRIIQTLKEAFKNDKKKTIVYPFTQLNLVQIARKRRGKSIYDYIEDDCSLCRGKGKKIKLTYLNNLIKNEIIKISKEYEFKDIHIEIDEIYKKDILGNVIEFINEIEALDKRVYVSFISNLEYFKVEALLFASQIKKFENIKIYG